MPESALQETRTEETRTEETRTEETRTSLGRNPETSVASDTHRIPTQEAIDLWSAARRFGDLRINYRRLKSARWRLHALLALIPAAADRGFSTRSLESDLRPALDTLLAGRRSALGHVATVASERLEAWIGESTSSDPKETDPKRKPASLQALAASLAKSRRLAPYDCVGALVAAGAAEQARALAAVWPEPRDRHRLERLAKTGLSGCGHRRRFIAPPFGDEFPASLPCLVAMAHASKPGQPLSSWQWDRADELLAGLKRAERQTGLIHLAHAAYHAGGLAAAASKVRSIRYRSSRRRAWLRVLWAALESGHLGNAWRAFAEIPPGADQERGRILLAHELTHRSQSSDGRRSRSRALRLLAGPFREELLEEQALARSAIEPWRLPRLRRRWREHKAKASEDLANLDFGLPALRHRWTALALNTALEAGMSEESRPSAIYRLEIPARCVNELVEDRAALRSWLSTFGPGQDVAALSLLRRIAPANAEPIRSELISMAAGQLGHGAGPRPSRHDAASFYRGLLGLRKEEKSNPKKAEKRARAPGPTRAKAPEGEKRSPSPKDTASAIHLDRCLFDEGRSLSPDAESRRRVILGAVKFCLSSWLLGGVVPAKGALDSRLRTLVNLGGSLATEQLGRVLERATHPGPAFIKAYGVYSALAPDRARRLLIRHLVDLLGTTEQARELLFELEEHGLIDAGFTRGWIRFIERIRQRFGVKRGGMWLQGVVKTWPTGQWPTISAVECCDAEVKRGWPRQGENLIPRIAGRVDTLLSLPPAQVPAALLEDPLSIKRLLWLRPGPTARISERTWKADLGQIEKSEVGAIDPRLVFKFAASLKPRRGSPAERAVSRQAVAESLLAGQHPVAESLGTVDLPGRPGGARYRLRYLDKRRDLFTYLRFADCAPCCFNSKSVDYRAWGMKFWILTLWKDPLSLCFHVEKYGSDGTWRPRGFVFGGFALRDFFHCEPTPAILLNGLYLRRQNRQLRASILTAIEETLCKPLAIAHVGIANRHGGRGPLPAFYSQREAVVLRCSALKGKFGPVKTTFDDISSVVNRMEKLDHLYWRHLSIAAR